MSDTTIPHRCRPDAAPIEVIGVGLGRTGTTSLWAALDILGFGPAYHPMQSQTEDWAAWAEILEGKDTSPEAFDRILRGYRSVVDSPVATMYREVYAAYPNAKFILTVRDPVKWAESIKTTTLKSYILFSKHENQLTPEIGALFRWCKAYFDGYHKGRLVMHAEEEIENHNEHVKALIPTDRILIYDIKEGWDPLAKFLGVPKPDVPFPRLNDREAFQRPPIPG
ncbi:hypothetical protein Clacol_007167 [Clathrus columnatus]|uniref:Sulfotransferase n=1 Tax=Clathrus columnatus TaxID=1419009 RepID=A0AAV5AJ84_9AGAM|nr:hypothetical protein Clacol_007167 [Clathrus columnatus]